jgi:hypothetical protein
MAIQFLPPKLPELQMGEHIKEKGHGIISKAQAVSTLHSNLSNFFACNSLAVSCTQEIVVDTMPLENAL